MLLPCQAERDGRRPRLGQRRQVYADQLLAVRAPRLDRERVGEEVADVAQPLTRLRHLPVEEADLGAVEEEVADVGVAVDQRERGPRPERLEREPVPGSGSPPPRCSSAGTSSPKRSSAGRSERSERILPMRNTGSRGESAQPGEIAVQARALPVGGVKSCERPHHGARALGIAGSRDVREAAAARDQVLEQQHEARVPRRAAAAK